MRTLVLVLALMASSAHADAKDDAIRAAAEDCITTGTVLSFGGVSELNPLGPIASCAIKPIAIAAVDDLPEPNRTEALQGMHAAWGGAAVNNLFAMLGAGPAGPVFGIFIALGLYASGEDERSFMHECAIHRRLANDNTLKCNYKVSHG